MPDHRSNALRGLRARGAAIVAGPIPISDDPAGGPSRRDFRAHHKS